MSPRLRFAAAIGSWLTLWPWPARVALESDMAVHMTIQVSLLIGIGVFLATGVRSREPHWLADADWLGIPGIVMVVLGTSFWMLPRALDGAVADPLVDAAKFLSLPLLVGLPLGRPGAACRHSAARSSGPISFPSWARSAASIWRHPRGFAPIIDSTSRPWPAGR